MDFLIKSKFFKRPADQAFAPRVRVVLLIISPIRSSFSILRLLCLFAAIPACSCLCVRFFGSFTAQQ